MTKSILKVIFHVVKHLSYLINTTGASAEPSDGATSSDSSAPVFGLGDKFKKEEGSWDCDVCLLQNKAADVQCVACQAAKPGAKVEPKGNKNDKPLGFCNKHVNSK